MKKLDSEDPAHPKTGLRCSEVGFGRDSYLPETQNYLQVRFRRAIHSPSPLVLKSTIITSPLPRRISFPRTKI